MRHGSFLVRPGLLFGGCVGEVEHLDHEFPIPFEVHDPSFQFDVLCWILMPLKKRKQTKTPLRLKVYSPWKFRGVSQDTFPPSTSRTNTPSVASRFMLSVMIAAADWRVMFTPSASKAYILDGIVVIRNLLLSCQTGNLKVPVCFCLQHILNIIKRLI